MLKYYQQHSVNEDLIKVGSRPKENAWVSGINVTREDVNTVTGHFGLDPNVTRDVLDRDELSRIEHSDDTIYVFVRTPRLSSRGTLQTTPMLMAVKGSVYITLSSDEFDAPEKLPASSRLSDTLGLLLDTVAAVVGDYQDCIRQTGKYIRDTERRLHSREVNNADFVHFVAIEAALNAYHTNLSGIIAVAERLKDNGFAHVKKVDIEAIEDIILHIRQLLVAVNGHLQAVSSIRNAYGTIANNTLNQRMKTLTVLTVLLAVPNVFYGMYGMNVILPFSEEPWAYFAIVGFTTALIAIVFIVAKRFRVF